MKCLYLQRNLLYTESPGLLGMWWSSFFFSSKWLKLPDLWGALHFIYSTGVLWAIFILFKIAWPIGSEFFFSKSHDMSSFAKKNLLFTESPIISFQKEHETFRFPTVKLHSLKFSRYEGLMKEKWMIVPSTNCSSFYADRTRFNLSVSSFNFYLKEVSILLLEYEITNFLTVLKTCHEFPYPWCIQILWSRQTLRKNTSRCRNSLWRYTLSIGGVSPPIICLSLPTVGLLPSVIDLSIPIRVDSPSVGCLSPLIRCVSPLIGGLLPHIKTSLTFS